jgi:hypothetical protein
MSNQSLLDYYTPTGGGADQYFDILNRLEDRLKVPGIIKTAHAADLVRSYPYHVAQRVFRSIMLEMIKDGKAKTIGRGIYKIIDQNEEEITPLQRLQEARQISQEKPAPARTWFSSVYNCEMSI